MIDPNRSDWISLFESSTLLKQEFKLFKRNDGSFLIKVKQKGPERSLEELQKVFLLVRHSTLVWMEANYAASGRQRRSKSPDSTLNGTSSSSSVSHSLVPVTTDSLHPIPGPSQSQLTIHEMERSESTQSTKENIISAFRNSMEQSLTTNSAGDLNMQTETATFSQESSSQVQTDVFDAPVVYNGKEEEVDSVDEGRASNDDSTLHYPCSSSQARAPLPPPATVTGSNDCNNEDEMPNENDDDYEDNEYQVSGPLSNSSVGTTLLELDVDRLAEIEEDASNAGKSESSVTGRAGD